MLPHIHPFGLEISMYWLFHVLGALSAMAVLCAKRRTAGLRW